MQKFKIFLKRSPIFFKKNKHNPIVNNLKYRASVYQVERQNKC